MFWMLHEVADQPGLWRQVAAHLRPGGRALVVEPRMHVSEASYERSVQPALDLGLEREAVTGDLLQLC